MTVATDPTDSSTGTTKDAPDSLIPLDVLLRQRLPGAFSDNDVVEIARLAYEELELRVGTRLSESLTDVQLAEFEALIDSEDHEGAQHFLAETEQARSALGKCTTCGAPSPAETCAFCRLVERAVGVAGSRDTSNGENT